MSWNIKYNSLNEFVTDFEDSRIWTKFGEISSVEIFNSADENYVNLFTLQSGSRIKNISKYQFTVTDFIALDFSKVLPGLTIFLNESAENSADDWDLLTTEQKNNYNEIGNSLLNESRLVPAWPLAETTYSPNIDVYDDLDEVISGSTLACPGFATVPLTKTLTIKNTGTAPLRLTNSIVATQMQNASFSISQPSSTVIQAGSSTTFGITISSANPGTYTCQVIISSNDENEGSYIININSVIEDAPAPILRGYSALQSVQSNITFPISNFGDTVTGVFKIANEGNSNLTISSMTVSDSQWTLLDYTSGTIGSQGSRNYTISFESNAQGLASGALTITSNNSVSPSTYTVWGYAI